MAKTEYGLFDIAYHHIDAPTNTDTEWGKTHKQRKLINPNGLSDEKEFNSFRTTELYYLRNNDWFAWRKLDGQNLRVHWNGEQALWNGKSNKFVPAKELSKYMNETFAEELFEEKFGRDKRVTLFGEHMGPKSQGNELGLNKDQFVLFDVLIGETWLEYDQVQDIANFFNIYTPASFGEVSIMSLKDLINVVASGKYSSWEGIVAHPMGRLRDQKGNRIIVKIKNKDYNA